MVLHFSAYKLSARMRQDCDPYDPYLGPVRIGGDRAGECSPAIQPTTLSMVLYTRSANDESHHLRCVLVLHNGPHINERPGREPNSDELHIIYGSALDIRVDTKQKSGKLRRE